LINPKTLKPTRKNSCISDNNDTLSFQSKLLETQLENRKLKKETFKQKKGPSSTSCAEDLFNEFSLNMKETDIKFMKGEKTMQINTLLEKINELQREVKKLKEQRWLLES